MTKINYKQVLLSKVEDNDYGAETVIELLLSQAKELLTEKSVDYHDDLIRSLILNRHLRGELDEFGFVDDFDRNEYATILDDVLNFLIDADHGTIEAKPEPRDHILVKVDATDPLNPRVLDSYSDAMTLEDAKKIRDEEEYITPYIKWHVLKVPV